MCPLAEEHLKWNRHTFVAPPERNKSDPAAAFTCWSYFLPPGGDKHQVTVFAEALLFPTNDSIKRAKN